MTTMPTTNTTIVARIGTSTSGSSQARAHAGRSRSAASPGSGATVPTSHGKRLEVERTFVAGLPGPPDHAHHDDGDDDHEDGGHDGHDEVEVRQDDLEGLLGRERAAPHLSRRRDGT